MRVRTTDLKPSKFASSIYDGTASADLIQSIEENGLLVPIWIADDNTIIAGHRRVDACRRLGLSEIEVEVKPFSESLVIESNRYRDKTSEEKLREADALEKIEAAKAKERMLRGKAIDPAKNSAQGETREVVAAAVGVSHDTLSKLRTIREAKPELLAQIDAGEKSVNAAYRMIKREQNLEEFHAKEVPLPEGKFNIIYADPPWQYDYSLASNREIENQYPTMTLEAIRNLPLADCLADDAVLFLWVTNPKLAEGLEVSRAWGFSYRTNMVWVKDKIGMGYYTRQKHELLLIGKRGNFRVPEPGARPDSVIEAPRRGHSEKPEVVYRLIENMYPTGKYLELFARTERPGWVAWGLEVECATGDVGGGDSACGED
jgi:N6-adenosine-specific RNA methylase IME4/ParB-like chromosome segregation protein Spo0J